MQAIESPTVEAALMSLDARGMVTGYVGAVVCASWDAERSTVV